VSFRTPCLVPQPARLAEGGGAPVVLGDPLVVSADQEVAGEARWFRRVLGAGVGLGVELDPTDPTAQLRLRTGLSRPSGSYRLTVGDGRVEVAGADPAGVFYGLQTLRQLLPDAVLRRARPLPDGHAAPMSLGALVVEDTPRFEWRGVHLDVARHFMPTSFVLKLIDLAAFHKCNVLHLHLTDDQGWRLPVDRHPRLTDVGAWRRESPAGHKSEGRFDGVPHGGYYTREDIGEMVSFAAERHVTVVPEIDMPGHMVAAIASYRELGGAEQTLEVDTHWGVSPHVLNLEDRTVEWCTEVLDEVAALFPGPWFHIGGDECPTVEWETSARGRALMARFGFSHARQLQGWFSGRIAGHLARMGRTVVGWDEMLDAGAPEGAVVMCWRGEKQARAALSQGHDVVMASEPWLYFDWAQSGDPGEPLAIGGITPWERVYSFEPVPPGLPDVLRHHVLGAQCQLWTEYVPTPRRAEYQYFPRLCAFAEVVWSPPATPENGPAAGGRDTSPFRYRLARHLDRLAALDVNFRPLEGPTPGQSRVWRPRSVAGPVGRPPGH
jgi:hexosaminidase